MNRRTIEESLRAQFSEDQASLLAQLLVATIEYPKDLVRSGEFTELKELVKELVGVQRRTDERVEMLAEAQKRTEEKVEMLVEAQKALAEAQRRTEEKVEMLANTMREMAVAMQQMHGEMQEIHTEIRDTRREVGGLGKSVGYALENEAYRALPAYLRREYGIDLTESLIRVEIGGEEVNLFGRGQREGHEVIVVGECTLRLENSQKFGQLERKMHAAMCQYPGVEVVAVMIAHFATRDMLHAAEENGVIVVQSFQW